MSLRLGVTFIGLDRWRRDNATAAKRIPSEMEKNLRKAAILVRDQAKKNVSGGPRTRAAFGIKGGKRVRKPKPGPVTAPPNQLGVFEGRLRNSINYDIDRRGKTLDAEVGSDVKYARIHELGGTVSVPSWGYKTTGNKHTVRIPARPYLQPAIDKTENQVFRLLGQTFKVVT